MANETKMRSKHAKRRSRRSADVRKGQEGTVCSGELNMPGQSREEYLDNVLAQISEFEEELAELEFNLESAGWIDSGEYRVQFEELRLRLESARAKSAELEAAADSTWPSGREDMEDTLLEIANTLEDLTMELGRVLPE